MPEIERAKMTLPAGTTPERAQIVSRMIFEHLLRIVRRDATFRTGAASRVVNHLVVPPLEIEWDESDNDTIARTGAAWIYRWIKASE